LKASCLNEKSPGDLRHQGRVIYKQKSRTVAEHPSVTVRLIGIKIGITGLLPVCPLCEMLPYHLPVCPTKGRIVMEKEW
jgi:hypothetical protein